MWIFLPVARASAKISKFHTPPPENKALLRVDLELFDDDWKKQP